MMIERTRVLPTLALAGVLATALTATGCGSSNSTTTPSTTSRVTSVQSPTVPGTPLRLGTYSRTLTRGDLRREGASLAGPPEHLPPGNELLNLFKGGRVEVTFFRGQFVAGTLTATRTGLFKLRGASDASFCGMGKTGTYRWSLKGGALVLAKAIRACAEEAAGLVGTWKYVG